MKQVAEKLNMAESTIQRYETGNISRLSYDTIVALANLLEVHPGYMMGWDTKQPYTYKDSTPVIEKHSVYDIALLKDFDALNNNGKEKVLAYVQDLISSGKYQTTG